MAVAFVQGVNVTNDAGLSGDQITLPSPPTPGNLLILFGYTGGLGTTPPGVPAGFATKHTYRDGIVAMRVVESGDSATWTSPGSDTRYYVLEEWSGVGVPTTAWSDATGPTNSGATASVTPAGSGAAAIAYVWQYFGGHTGVYWTASGSSTLAEAANRRAFWISAYNSPGNAVTATRSWQGYPWYAVAAVFPAAASTPTADFSGTPRSGLAPLTVDFTDLSTNAPTGWSWDFGDGGTSTSQNPTHVYTVPGTYTVELTATNGSGSDSETKTDYIVVGVPEPGVGISWDDVTFEDVTADLVSWVIRRQGTQQVGGSGSYTGSATIILRNRDNRYNPENVSGDLYGLLRDGPRIHIAVNGDGTLAYDAGENVHGLFAGRITSITPLLAGGATEPPLVEFVCEDALSWIARTPVQVADAVGRSHEDLRELILTAAHETSLDLDNEPTTMPLSGADGKAGDLLEQINGQNGTRHYIRPADDRTTDVLYEYVSVRRTSALSGSSSYALDAFTDHVTSTDWRKSADSVLNRQKVSVTPISFSPASVTVWQAENLPWVANDGDVEWTKWIEFDDYVQSPIVNVAYTGAESTVEITSFGRTAKLTISQLDGSHITHLTVEGSIARRAPQDSVVIDDDTGSQDAPRGVREGSEISGDFVGTLDAAHGLASHIVWRYADPKYTPTITVANWMPDQFDIDPYDLITLTSSQIGVADRVLEVWGITHTCNRAAPDGVHHVTQLDTIESRVQMPTQWFTWDVSEWDGPDLLAY